MVSGKTKSGIPFELNEHIKDDARFMFLLVKMQNLTEPIEAGTAMNKLLTLVFGSEDAAYEFMEQIADNHEGVCSSEVMMAELTDILESINAKN